CFVHGPATHASYTLSLHDALPILLVKQVASQGGVEVESYFHDYKAFGPVKMASRIVARAAGQEQILTIESVDYDAVDPAALRLPDRKSTRLNSSHVKISYAVFCLK